MRRKNAGGNGFRDSLTNSLKKAQSFTEGAINTALNTTTPRLERAQSAFEKGANKVQSFVEEKINQGKNMVSDEKTRLAIKEINAKHGDERVNVLNQILNDEDINKIFVVKPELKTEIIRNGLDAFLNANPDAKNEIIRNGLTVELFKEILNKNTQHKFNSLLKQDIEKKASNAYWDSALPQLGLKRKTGFFK